MEGSRIRGILAILVVGVFMIITGVLAIFPVFCSQEVDTAKYADFFNKTAGVYTGIVGVVIGYYFGRSTSGISGKDNTSSSSNVTSNESSNHP